MVAATLMSAPAFVSSNGWRAAAAATALIAMTSNSTSTKCALRRASLPPGTTPADIVLAFTVYVGTLIPVLLIFGGFADRFGRPPIVLAGMLFMAAGT
jgi:MFS family permease